VPRSAPQKLTTVAFPNFLADRAVRKPSPHTTKARDHFGSSWAGSWATDKRHGVGTEAAGGEQEGAHRQDFEAIATLLTGTTDAAQDVN